MNRMAPVAHFREEFGNHVTAQEAALILGILPQTVASLNLRGKWDDDDIIYNSF